MRWFTPARLAASGLFLLGAAAFVLWLLPDSGTDIRLVDPAHPVDPIVSVPSDAAQKPAATAAAEPPLDPPGV